LSFYLDRPTTLLPYKHASTTKNLQDFFKIYNPTYVGIKKVNDEALKSMGYFNNNYHKFMPKIGCKKVDALKTVYYEIWKCKNW